VLQNIFKTKINFVACSARLVLSHTDTLHHNQSNRKEGVRNDVTNHGILPRPPRGVRVEWNWNRCL